MRCQWDVNGIYLVDVCLIRFGVAQISLKLRCRWGHVRGGQAVPDSNKMMASTWIVVPDRGGVLSFVRQIPTTSATDSISEQKTSFSRHNFQCWLDYFPFIFALHLSEVRSYCICTRSCLACFGNIFKSRAPTPDIHGVRNAFEAWWAATFATRRRPLYGTWACSGKPQFTEVDDYSLMVLNNMLNIPIYGFGFHQLPIDVLFQEKPTYPQSPLVGGLEHGFYDFP